MTDRNVAQGKIADRWVPPSALPAHGPRNVVLPETASDVVLDTALVPAGQVTFISGCHDSPAPLMLSSSALCADLCAAGVFLCVESRCCYASAFAQS